MRNTKYNATAVVKKYIYVIYMWSYVNTSLKVTFDVKFSPGSVGLEDRTVPDREEWIFSIS